MCLATSVWREFDRLRCRAALQHGQPVRKRRDRKCL